MIDFEFDKIEKGYELLYAKQIKKLLTYQRNIKVATFIKVDEKAFYNCQN